MLALLYRFPRIRLLAYYHLSRYHHYRRWISTGDSYDVSYHLRIIGGFSTPARAGDIFDFAGRRPQRGLIGGRARGRYSRIGHQEGRRTASGGRFPYTELSRRLMIMAARHTGTSAAAHRERLVNAATTVFDAAYRSRVYELHDAQCRHAAVIPSYEMAPCRSSPRCAHRRCRYVAIGSRGQV